VPFTGSWRRRRSLLEVLAAFYEIDFGGVDYEEVGGGVAEEEMFVGAGDFLDVREGRFGVSSREAFLAMRGAEDFWRGLEVDDQVGARAARRLGLRSSARRA